MLANETILASAGSGKTYQLTNRYIGLMALQLRSGQEVAPERIIAVTFTRKAAGEFFDSILAKLAEAASGAGKAPNVAGDDLLAESIRSLTEQQYTELLRTFVDRMPRLYLGTLDSFYANVLRAFPGEFGLAGEFDILDDHAAATAKEAVYRTVFERSFNRGGGTDGGQQAFLEAFRQATHGREESRILHELDQFVGDLHGLYLEAPDGTRWGNEKAVWPEGCRFLGEKTDLEKDFAELFTLFRVADDPEGGKEATKVNWTYWEEFRAEAPEHRPGAKMTNRVGYMLEKLLPLWDQLSAGRAELNLNRKRHELGPKECAIVQRILRHLVGGEIRNKLARTHGVWELLDRYESVYADRIRRQGKLTFQDLALLLTGMGEGPDRKVPLLGQSGEAPDRLAIDYRLDARYDHWMLDEFQDTSFLQWKVVENLIDEVVQDTSGERSLFQVGDAKQSIYAWRGGDADLIRDILARYNRNETRIEKRNLDTSWRSGHDVIDPVNQLFGVPQVFDELGVPAATKEKWDWHDHQVAPPHEDLRGHTMLLNPVAPEGEKVEEEDRFDVVVALLEEMQPVARGIECAILVQTNEVGRRLVDHIRSESDIPVMSEADMPIAVDNALNRAALSLLQLGAHPGDSFSWEHLRMTPYLATIEKEELGPASLSTRIRRRVSETGFEATIRSFFGELEKSGFEPDGFHRHRSEEFALAARRFDESGSRDIDEFLAYARNLKVREPDAKSAVQVMTIHKSKGLTFDAVILPQLEGNAITTARNEIGAKRNANREVEWVLDLPKKEIYQADPVLGTFHDDREAEAAYENLCKLYVALTRARCANYLITTPRGQKSTSNNFVKWVETALVSGDPVEREISGHPVSVLFETALPTTDPKWFESFRLPEEKMEKPAPVPAPAGTKRSRPRRRAPSEATTHSLTAEQLFGRSGGAAREFGTLVHAIFESIEWIGADTMEIVSSQLDDRSDLASATAKEIRSQIDRCLSDGAFAQALTRPDLEVELWREKRFEILLDGEWISGVFDRVVIGSDTATVIDFKTDRVETNSEIAAAVERHRPQLELYRRVLSVLIGMPADRITAKLLFTGPGKVAVL